MRPSPSNTRLVPLQAGEVPIPGYRLVRRRGRGGFGEVWEAEGPGGFPVALKFVRLADPLQSPEWRSLDFVRGIRHPNLLTGFAAWLVDDTLIVGMDLADGSLWDRYLAASEQGYCGIPRGELLGYLAEVAAGVDHLNGYHHTVEGRSRVGIQHRDLKPTNILLFGGGAKVADLGMARAMEGEVAGHTGTWTFPYAAPEYFRGETTRQSDQYGLAATYCQLRGGRLPFSGSAATITAGHLFGRPDLDALPEVERAIVERGLAKEPGDRWPDCRAFIAALRALPDDAVADILIDPDGPPVHLGGPHAWEASESVDSRWLLDSTGGIQADSLKTSPTLILPADPACLPARPIRQRGWAYRLRALGVAGVAAVTLMIFALRGPGSEPPLRPLPPFQRFGAPVELVVAPEIEAPLSPEGIPVPPPAPSEVSVGVNQEEAATSEALPTQPSPDSELVVAVSPPTSADPKPKTPTDSTPLPSELALNEPIGMDDIAAEVARLPVVAPAAAELPTTLPSPVAPEAEPTEEIKPAPASALTPAPSLDRDQVVASTRPVGSGTPPTPRVTATVVPVSQPDPREAAFGRGRAAFARRAFAQAIPELTETLRLDPTHTPSHLLRGIARHRGGDPRGALADYNAVLLARPNDLAATLSRGQAYHELGDHARAEADYSTAIRLRPEDGDAHFRRGLTRFTAGDYAGAISDFTETLRLDRNHVYAGEFRTEALARRKAQTTRPVAPAGSSAVTTAPRPTEAPTQPVRETSLRATSPPLTAVSATSAAPQPRPTSASQATKLTEKRRGALRWVPLWPLARGR